MKTTRIYLILLVSCLVGPAVAYPGEHAGACYGLPDADARAYCLALAHRDTGRCYAIQRADMRAACFAEVPCSAVNCR